MEQEGLFKKVPTTVEVSELPCWMLHTGNYFSVTFFVAVKKQADICICKCTVSDKLPILNLFACKEHIVICDLRCI